MTARRKGIVVTELPYGVGTEKVIERIKTLVQAKKLQGIADIKDLTDREHGPAAGHRGQERLRPRGAARAALPARPPMEDSFGINAVALVDGQPRTLGLKEMLRGLPRPPLRRRTPPLGVPPRQGRRPAAPRRRPADRDPRHRRGHPADPRQRQRRRRQGAADLGLRPHRGPGRLHPRHAAAPADQVLQARAREGAGASSSAPSRSSTRSSATRSCCGRSSPTSSPRSPRPTAPRAVPSCSSRPAPAVTAAAAPLEVADDPCFVLPVLHRPARPHPRRRARRARAAAGPTTT